MTKIRILSTQNHTVDLRTRIPFKYGIATMTAFPLCFVEVECEIDGKIAKGIASDLLPPKWFKKDPTQDPTLELKELRSVICQACSTCINMEATTVFECWQQLYQAQAFWGNDQGHPSLLTHFGTSLIERALIDATCRHHNTPFHLALKQDLLGIQLGDIHTDLNSKKPCDFLSNKPLDHVISRHTVGLSDPLTNGDISDNDRLNDGLPQSLEDCKKTYGLKHFKIKICGDFKTDLHRIEAISKILDSVTQSDFAFSLDGNEQFTSAEVFKEYWHELTTENTLKTFFDKLLFIEQPLHREVALNEEVGEVLHKWINRPTIIIDESDGDLDSASRALELGYDGTSHKNCKGVFKSIANASMIQKRKPDSPHRPLILSGEDLCNQGPVSIMQDLCVAASLGIQSVERNGHHYCAGLSAHPLSVQKEMLNDHPDVYAPSNNGWPSVVIQQGCISTQSINASPFGIGFIPNISDYDMISK